MNDQAKPAPTVEELVEIIKAERKFLHDMSNQLLISQGMGGFVLNAIKKREGHDPKELQRMEKSMKALDKMVELVTDRRKILRSVS